MFCMFPITLEVDHNIVDKKIDKLIASKQRKLIITSSEYRTLKSLKGLTKNL